MPGTWSYAGVSQNLLLFDIPRISGSSGINPIGLSFLLELLHTTNIVSGCSHLFSLSICILYSRVQSKQWFIGSCGWLVLCDCHMYSVYCIRVSKQGGCQSGLYGLIVITLLSPTLFLQSSNFTVDVPYCFL